MAYVRRAWTKRNNGVDRPILSRRPNYESLVKQLNLPTSQRTEETTFMSCFKDHRKKRGLTLAEGSRHLVSNFPYLTLSQAETVIMKIEKGWMFIPSRTQSNDKDYLSMVKTYLSFCGVTPEIFDEWQQFLPPPIDDRPITPVDISDIFESH